MAQPPSPSPRCRWRAKGNGVERLHGPGGHPQLLYRGEPPIQLFGTERSGEQRAPAVEDELALSSSLPYQLHPKASDPASDQPWDGVRGALGPGVEDGVATRHVDQHRVSQSLGVLQLQPVPLARPPAARVIGPGGESSRVHAVLGVEGGDVMVDDDTPTSSRPVTMVLTLLLVAVMAELVWGFFRPAESLLPPYQWHHAGKAQAPAAAHAEH